MEGQARLTLAVPNTGYARACALRQAAGGMPTIRLNAREKAASDS
jgi:hypothetical protein